MLLIGKFLLKHQNNVYIKSIFAGLRPIVVGLIASAALILMNKENFPDYTLSILICIGAFCLVHYTKLHPIWIIVLAGVTGSLYIDLQEVFLNMTYEETLHYLYNQLPVFQQVGSSAYKPGLGNSEALDVFF